MARGTCRVPHPPAPATTGKPPISYSQIWPVGISKYSKNQDAAWEYLKWLTNAKTEKAVVLDKSKPEFDNVVAVHYSVLNDPEVGLPASSSAGSKRA